MRRSSASPLIMVLSLLVLILARLGLVTTIQEMTVAGIFDEGDTHYAEVFKQAVEDVNNNRYFKPFLPHLLAMTV